jgi:hypothetical protein
MSENTIVTVMDADIPNDAALVVGRNLRVARDAAFRRAQAIAANLPGKNGYLATAYFCDGEMVLEGKALGTGLRPSDPARGPEDKGTNYAALAISKIIQCVRTGQPAGLIAGFPKGEFEYKGSVILESTDGWRVYFSFSGFPDPKDDNAVAVACAESFVDAMKYYSEFPKKLTA